MRTAEYSNSLCIRRFSRTADTLCLRLICDLLADTFGSANSAYQMSCAASQIVRGLAVQMATGAPPHADLHPMRVLFLIPKSPAPDLEGPFSPELKDFVAVCLQKV